MKKILLIDQDDVMADFLASSSYLKKINPLIQFPQSQYKFFENLEPIEGAIESINFLKQYFDVCILTRPSVRNPLCYTEKRVWVEKHLGYDICNNLILACDKTMVMGDYLIDDVIHSGRFNPTWEHIHFGSEKFPDWNSVVEYLIEIYNETSKIKVKTK